MTIRLNINADLGESFGAWTMGSDDQMLRIIGSANLACGFHAGDPLVIRQSLRAARANLVSVGAHPSYPDLQGFGRRPMRLTPEELEAGLIYQIAALDGMAACEGWPLKHVKPHGALNNAACADTEIANVIVKAIVSYRRDLILLAPALSPLAKAGRAAGLRVVDEIFADRAYLDNGQLMPRGLPGAVIESAEACLIHVLRMLESRAVVSNSGVELPTEIGSVCVHGDGPHAVTTAAYLRRQLTDSCGFELVTLPQLFTG